ncbi:MAG TPA: hypothetical protein DDW20_04825 [Firmicutes bacterium]|nr:hypothetical protein [Bacillota bacterium]
MQEENQPLVSIVIPVYNVQDYLMECVDSAVEQTYKNLEIILVDDGSTDKSVSLCDEWKNKDSRIKVIHKINGGLSDARNVGIKECKGKYIFFLDSDDLIDIITIEKMVSIAEKKHVDVVTTNLFPFYDYLQIKNENELQIDEISNSEAMKRMFLSDRITLCSCGKLFLTKLWKNIEFPKGLLYEDYATTFYVFGKSNMVAIINNSHFYYYRMRNNSIIHSSMSNRNFVIFDIAEGVTKYIASTFPEIKEYAEYMELVTNLKFLKRIMDVGFNAYAEVQKRAMKCIEKYKYLIKRPWAKTSDKIKVKLLSINKYVFYVVYSFAEKIEYYKTKHGMPSS